MFWYKHEVGHLPRVMAMIQTFGKPLFYNEFSNSRFNAQKVQGDLSLIIMNTNPTDEAIYYCGIKQFAFTEFSNGTFLALKGNQCKIYSKSLHNYITKVCI